MPTLSASDYTQYLKFKAAAGSTIRPAIQTRDNVSLSQSLINAQLLASQAAFVTTPANTTVTTLPAVVTEARTAIISAITNPGSGATRYTTSQPHGLVTGDVITITGLDQGTMNVNPNQSNATITRESDTQFRIQVAYTSGTPGAALGSITGRVYYTTNAAHGLITGTIVSVTGLSGFNVSLTSAIVAATDATTFSLLSGTTGTAVTGASGALSVTRYANTNMALTTNARVQALPVPQFRSTPDAKSTVSFAGTSGALGSSPVQRPGGLPTGFKNSQSTYTRLPQSAGW